MNRLKGLVVVLLASTACAQAQESLQDRLKAPELLSYEGQKVSSVELAGRPDLDLAELTPLVAQPGGENFSSVKIDQTIAALQSTGRFTAVQLDLRPEQDGVRVIFILQPAVYFGIYQFPGAERFAYARLLQVANYVQQEPYSQIDIQKARDSLLAFLHKNGYFEAEVNPEVEVDKANGLANVNFRVTLNRVAQFGGVLIEGALPGETERLKDRLDSLRARIKSSAVREGKDYSLKTLQNAAKFMESRLRSEKRLAAQVRLTGSNYDPQTNRADVTFDANPGPMVRAAVEGVHLWPWTRHKLLPVYQQNALTPYLIEEGRQNLLKRYRDKGYNDVQVDLETRVQPDGLSIVYRVRKGDRKEIAGAAFSGNRSFDENELLKHVNVRRATFFSNGRYNDDSVGMLEAFYQSKGFNQVKVTPQFPASDNDVIVTFIIDEGPQDIVQAFRVEGNNFISLSDLAPKGLQLGPGRPFAQRSIDEDRNRIMSHYLDQGYLIASFRADAQPYPNDPHQFQVVYRIHEGPRVKTENVVTIGQKITKDTLIGRQTDGLQPGKPLTEREILSSESRLYTTGIFDWAEVNPRRQITTQEQEDVIVKVHESKRNTLTYGFGYEIVNKGGTIPGGTVVAPGLPAFQLPSTFTTNQETVHGPRVNALYVRSNVRGKAESLTLGGLYGPLDRRASLAYIDPNFRWTQWTATVSGTGEFNKENPIFNAFQGQFGFQLQKPITADKTQTLYLRYTFTQTALRNLLIPELVPPDQLHTTLSTLGAVWIRDTRDNPFDAHTGAYQSFEFDVNPAPLGSNFNFGKLLAQGTVYRKMRGVVWANSLRLGFLQATFGSEVPISQKFFTGGGSTLRGFPLNGAGPQTTVTACSNPSDPATCSLVQVPTGGNQLVIFNSEFRLPVPQQKKLTFAAFYDGGNAFERIGFGHLGAQWTNSVGVGFRYNTPVGPIRVDLGHNVSPIPGIKPTQLFITLGQAF